MYFVLERNEVLRNCNLSTPHFEETCSNFVQLMEPVLDFGL